MIQPDGDQAQDGLKVLVFLPAGSLYGGCRAPVLGAKGLRAMGYESVFALADGPLWALLEQEGIRGIPTDYRNWIQGQGGKIKGLRRWIGSHRIAQNAAADFVGENFDLCHTQTIHSPVGAMISKRLGIPHVWHIHEGFQTVPPLKFLLGLPHARHFIDRSTELVIVNSQYTAGATHHFIDATK